MMIKRKGCRLAAFLFYCLFIRSMRSFCKRSCSFWGSFHGIYGTELTDDGLSLKKGAPIEQIAGTAYEGTYIHKRDGYYYWF